MNLVSIENKQSELLRLVSQLVSVETALKEIDITSETVSDWLNNDEEFRRNFDRAMLSIPVLSAPRAWATVLSILDSDYPAERLKAARLLLECAGYAVTAEVNVNVRNDGKDFMEKMREIASQITHELEYDIVHEE